MRKDQSCPVCGQLNQCAIACGGSEKDACWCKTVKVPAHILQFLADGQLEPSCLCRRCLNSLAYHAQTVSAPAEVLALIRNDMAMKPGPGECYFDEYGRMVFTAEYHLRRGYCCASGCRHCPY